MEYLIAVFKSRTQVMKFCEELKSKRIVCSVVNTPREASLGCGLSVKFYTHDFEQAKRLLWSSNYYSFSGIFKVTENGKRKTVRPY